MNDELRNISHHMREFGLLALAHANFHANSYSLENSAWNQLSVIQAAHSAEILIKARIAEEHPLLIFEHLPKSDGQSKQRLELEHLFENGRTIQFQDLPEKLWASTGIHLHNLKSYQAFGRLRNTIQHFTCPKDRDLSQETLEFVFNVIDPFINECWGLFAIDYNEDSEKYAYFVPPLIERKIKFLVSPELMDNKEQGELSYHDIEWPQTDDYTDLMKQRLGIS